MVEMLLMMLVMILIMIMEVMVLLMVMDRLILTMVMKMTLMMMQAKMSTLILLPTTAAVPVSSSRPVATVPVPSTIADGEPLLNPTVSPHSVPPHP